MNWKLILQLSMFGLAMGLATVFFIPSNIEPVFWVAIFLFCAYVLAKRATEQPFMHGLFLGVVNGLWITAAHVALFSRYMSAHVREANMMNSLPVPPVLVTAVAGIASGVVSGIVIGVLALVAGKLVKRGGEAGEVQQGT